MPASFKEEIIKAGFFLLEINQDEELIQHISPEDIIVLDHYNIASPFQQSIKNNGNKLVCIDDLHKQEFYADLIINHAPNVSPEVYQAQSYTKFALGLSYALLRPSFLKEAGKKKVDRDCKSVMICFGGADPKNLSATILQAVIRNNFFNSIEVVLGPSYNFCETLKHSLNLTDVGPKKIELHFNLEEKEIIKVMTRSYWSIIPSSGILFEAIACGCEAISGYYVDNQKDIYEGFRHINAIHDARDFLKIDQLLKNVDNFEKKNSGQLIDGKSGERLLQLFEKL